MALFFLHGARLSHAAVFAGVTHWRLHLAVLTGTFVLFPLLGALLGPLFSVTLGPSLALGMLFLCCLPSTVQSSIAFTSIARGNVPAAVVSASLSNILGIVLTPILTGLLLARSGAISTDAFMSIATLLLLPFVAGHLLRPLIGEWVARHRAMLGLVDRGSILLMVYAAFSKAVIGGLWLQVSGLRLLGLLLACCLLLALVPVAHYIWRAPRGFCAGGRNPDRVLWLEEVAGDRHADGQCAVCRRRGGHDRAAPHGVSPGPAAGMRLAGTALCPPLANP